MLSTGDLAQLLFVFVFFCFVSWCRMPVVRYITGFKEAVISALEAHCISHNEK